MCNYNWNAQFSYSLLQIKNSSHEIPEVMLLQLPKDTFTGKSSFKPIKSKLFRYSYLLKGKFCKVGCYQERWRRCCGQSCPSTWPSRCPSSSPLCSWSWSWRRRRRSRRASGWSGSGTLSSGERLRGGGLFQQKGNDRVKVGFIQPKKTRMMRDFGLS